MHLTQRKVVMEGFGKRGPLVFKRAIEHAWETGHIAKGWQGTEYFQWKGKVTINNACYTVYGYTLESGTPPTEFSNDSY